MRPSLLKSPEGHTISRRSAAEGGADAPLVPSKAARRTASTLTNASHQLSGGSTAVVRAECTAARPLARWHQQPRQQVQLEAAGAAAEVGGSGRECATIAASAIRRFGGGTSIF